MPMFDYVMVLASIVIGLALTHLMQGVAGLIQQPSKVRCLVGSPGLGGLYVRRGRILVVV